MYGFNKVGGIFLPITFNLFVAAGGAEHNACLQHAMITIMFATHKMFRWNMKNNSGCFIVACVCFGFLVKTPTAAEKAFAGLMERGFS